MLRRLINFYRSKRTADAQQQVTERLIGELAPYQRIAALVYPVTDYVDDADVAAIAAKLMHALGDRLHTVVSADPGWQPAGYAGLPVKSLSEISRDETDCVLIPSNAFAEVLFHMFNTSEARSLPVVAPALPGVPHRLFLRRELMKTLSANPDPEVLEIGSIEHPLGGHRTTQALAETLWGHGALTTVDLNPFTLKLAEMYCAATPTKISYLAGDCREVLRDAQGVLDFALLHFMSDNSAACAPLIETFDLIQPRLAMGARVVYQTVNTPDALPHSLQAHLKAHGYSSDVTPVAGASNPSRFFVVSQRS